jgi:putative transcriptional regulator
MELENNLRRCRFEAGEMTQQELADAVGVTRQTIIAIEKGKFYPTTLLAIKISRVFGKTVEDIFTIAEEK